MSPWQWLQRERDAVAAVWRTKLNRVSFRVPTAAQPLTDTLRNRKDTAISVEVNEPIGGDWTMTSATHRWTKTEAWAARFAVPVTAGGAATLRYRIRVTW